MKPPGWYGRRGQEARRLAAVQASQGRAAGMSRKGAPGHRPAGRADVPRNRFQVPESFGIIGKFVQTDADPQP